MVIEVSLIMILLTFIFLSIVVPPIGKIVAPGIFSGSF